MVHSLHGYFWSIVIFIDDVTYNDSINVYKFIERNIIMQQDNDKKKKTVPTQQRTSSEGKSGRF